MVDKLLRGNLHNSDGPKCTKPTGDKITYSQRKQGAHLLGVFIIKEDGWKINQLSLGRELLGYSEWEKIWESRYTAATCSSEDVC